MGNDRFISIQFYHNMVMSTVSWSPEMRGLSTSCEEISQAMFPARSTITILIPYNFFNINHLQKPKYGQSYCKDHVYMVFSKTRNQHNHLNQKPVVNQPICLRIIAWFRASTGHVPTHSFDQFESRDFIRKFYTSERVGALQL